MKDCQNTVRLIMTLWAITLMLVPAAALAQSATSGAIAFSWPEASNCARIWETRLLFNGSSS